MWSAPAFRDAPKDAVSPRTPLQSADVTNLDLEVILKLIGFCTLILQWLLQIGFYTHPKTHQILLLFSSEAVKT